MTGLLEVISLAVLILLLRVLRKRGKPKEVRPEPAVEEKPVGQIHLKELSRAWREEKGERVISLADLSRNWRDKPAPPQTQPVRENPAYRHAEIAAFYRERVAGKPNMKENVLDCVEALLEILDKVGDCPSVVNSNENEVESKLETNVYTKLAGLPLYRHALNVAEEMARLSNNELMAPMAIIAGLAHDLGKIPSYHDTLYSTGDHPHIAQTVMEDIVPFGKLHYAGEVKEAVRQHHRPQPETDLGKRLKKADQACRNREIALLLGPNKGNRTDGEKPEADQPAVAKPPGPAAAAETSVPSPASPSPPEKRSAREAEGTVAASSAIFGGYLDQDADIFGATWGEEGRVVNSLVPIDWFDSARVLAYLKQFINRMKGGRFYAFSMPDGTVYIQVGFFWSAAKRLSGNDTRLLTADADIQTRRDIMFSMVERLKEKKAIATDLLGPGFFMATFVIKPDSGEPWEENLIPFRAEAFGEPVAIMEARKVYRLKDVREVVAKHLMEKEDSTPG